MPPKITYPERRFDLKYRLKQNYRLAQALPEFLRRRITVAQAEEEIKKALESREERFLELARTRIYDRPANPYLKLFKIAGCEFADLHAHVHRRGLEATLEELAREGVYLTADEFKGKTEVRRGRASFRVSLKDFEPEDPLTGFVTQSSGGSNAPVHSIIPLDRIAIQALEVATHRLT